MSHCDRWLIRRNGTLLDRQARTVIGHVWYDPDRRFGWCAKGPTRTHSGAVMRRIAAGWAWHEWYAASLRRRDLITQRLNGPLNGPGRNRVRNRLRDLVQGFFDDDVPVHLLVGDLERMRLELTSAQRELVREAIDLICGQRPPEGNPETPAR